MEEKSVLRTVGMESRAREIAIGPFVLLVLSLVPAIALAAVSWAVAVYGSSETVRVTESVLIYAFLGAHFLVVLNAIQSYLLHRISRRLLELGCDLKQTFITSQKTSGMEAQAEEEGRDPAGGGNDEA